MVICLELGAGCLHMVQLMPLHSKTPSSLALFKSRLVLPFWYRLTQVVLEKWPLNGRSGRGNSSSSYSTTLCRHTRMELLAMANVNNLLIPRTVLYLSEIIVLIPHLVTVHSSVIDIER